MKYLLFAITLTLGFNSSAFCAEECEDTRTQTEATEVLEIKNDVPKGLEGSVILIVTPTGTTSCPIEKCKVVPRQQQFITTKTTVDNKRLCRKSEKNRLSLLAGKSPRNHLNRSTSGTTTSVENEYGNTFGVQYERDLGFEILGLPAHGGLQVQDNKGGAALFGVSY